MAKLHGLETLFFGTAVVCAPAGSNSSLPAFNQSVEGVLSILLILVTLLYICFSSTNDYIEAGTGADPLHRRAADQAAPEVRTTSAFFCIGCKPRACRFVRLVVHFSTVATVARDRGRLLSLTFLLSPEAMVLTNGLFSNPPSGSYN